MKKLFLLFTLSFVFASCNQTEAIEPTIDDDVIITTHQEGRKVLYTITVNYAQGDCVGNRKTWKKLQNELNAIFANNGTNMALVQVTGHHWEGNNLCICRANKALQEFNRWAATNGVGQSFGIATCQTHIHSGPENQVAVLEIDAFL